MPMVELKNEGKKRSGKMKILITGVGPWLDKGEAAMIISTAKALKGKFPNATIAISEEQPLQETDVISYRKYWLKVLSGPFQCFFLDRLKIKSIKPKTLRAMALLILLLVPMVKYTLWLLIYKGLQCDARFLIRNNKDIVKEYRDADKIIC